MSKLHFKGGPWTNAEDAVLKAALAQYGLRDWERVASMLTKKTAAQCRERWENYTDPRLNIREAWSLEEEEKLVELQSLFPNKFRLISEQLTRRTPTHYIRPAWLCEQRYLELKDEQEHYLKQQQQVGERAEAEADKQSLEAFMAERRRRRNARKTHEERAARADTVSGELYESEMVSMATSRLANQDQKKGLRKERQRQLEEAAFLAKLESNREGIESGTLSLRQSKKMRKALEEDRKSSGLVDIISEDDGEGSGAEEEEEEDDRSAFEAIDMYEDQQEAGLVKKQRVLMKDLAGQQRAIQQRQMAGGVGGGEDEGDEGSGSSRARAALTGVNQDLLRQLTAGPASKTRTTTTSATPLLQNRVFTAADTAKEAQAELKSSLADLFAALPQAVSSSSSAPDASLPSPLPPPPLKRPREALLPSATHADAGVEESRVASAPTPSSSSSSSAPVDLLSALNLPAPRKYTRTETTAEASVQQQQQPEQPSHGGRSLKPVPATPSREAAVDDVEEGEADVVSFASAAEEETYITAARRRVEVECEIAAQHARETQQQQHGHESRNGSGASSPPMTPDARAAAEELIQREHTRISSSGNGAAEAFAAVRAYVADLPHYTSRVNVQNALHDLSVRVAAQVQAANAVLKPLRQEWEQVVAVAMLDPREMHVLQGYVRDDGHLKQPLAFVEDSEDGAPAPSSAVAAYVYEHLVLQLTRARQATRFVAALRDREQLKMRRDLDAAEFELQQLQAREKTLQDMYREKRVQQA